MLIPCVLGKRMGPPFAQGAQENLFRRAPTEQKRLLASPKDVASETPNTTIWPPGVVMQSYLEC